MDGISSLPRAPPASSDTAGSPTTTVGSLTTSPRGQQIMDAAFLSFLGLGVLYCITSDEQSRDRIFEILMMGVVTVSAHLFIERTAVVVGTPRERAPILQSKEMVLLSFLGLAFGILYIISDEQTRSRIFALGMVAATTASAHLLIGNAADVASTSNRGSRCWGLFDLFMFSCLCLPAAGSVWLYGMCSAWAQGECFSALSNKWSTS